MAVERHKIRAAEWLYRWSLSSGIIGIVFTILSFMGVFTLVLGPLFTERFGFSFLQTALLLFALVILTIVGFGVYLDKVVHFWSAQATVGTVRNPFLVSALYQKELLLLKHVQVPQIRALLALVRQLPQEADRSQLEEDLLTSLQRLQETIGQKEWRIDPEERTY
jgi:hypothetical protein